MGPAPLLRFRAGGDSARRLPVYDSDVTGAPKNSTAVNCVDKSSGSKRAGAPVDKYRVMKALSPIRSHAASRDKLPAESLAALRKLSRILGGSEASIAPFFETPATRQSPCALARRPKSRETKLPTR